MDRSSAPRLAAIHEVINELADVQTEADRDMDDLNNHVAANAPEFRTWEELVEWARGKVVEAAPYNGDGQNGRVSWHRKEPADWRPDFTDVPITPIEKGGAEYRYGADVEDVVPIMPPEGAAAGPLDRPVETWSEQDVRAVLNSQAYLEPQHAMRERAQRMIRMWFERRFGTGPARIDATGRPVREDPIVAKSGGCPVPVRAHARKGGKIEVQAHCRATPAA